MPDEIFLDPDNVLPRLHEQLKVSRCVVITGMAGIGKSTIARVYIDRYQNYYKKAIVVDAQFPDRLLQGFCDKVMDGWENYPVYQRLMNAKTDADRKSAQEAMRDQTLEWISGGKYKKPLDPYIFVYQAVDTPGDYLHSYSDCTGAYLCVLYTSRVQNFDTSIAARFPIPLMPNAGAVELLWRYSGLNEQQYLQLSADERLAAENIACNVAGRLPLALRAIGKAYQGKEFTSFTQFAALHHEDVENQKRTFGYNEDAFGKTVLPTEESKGDHPKVYETFRVCFNMACDSAGGDDQKGAAPSPEKAAVIKDLLAVLAVLGAAFLPQAVIERSAASGLLGENLKTAATQPRGIEKAIVVADSCGLLEWTVPTGAGGGETRGVRMHSVVQEVIWMDMDESALAAAGVRAVRLVETALQLAQTSGVFNEIRILTPHARALYSQGMDLTDSPSLLQMTADFQVQEALAGGDWSCVFTDKPGDTPSYSDFRNMEKPKWAEKMTRIISSISEATSDDTQARQCFACIYFLAHYWWDGYFENTVPPAVRLVDTLPDAWSAAHGSPEDLQFVQSLREFQSHFPAVESFRDRAARKQDWNVVNSALTRITALIGVALDNLTPDDIKAFTPSMAYVHGIASIYTAAALRYADGAKGYHPGDNPRLWKLYAQAQDLFARLEENFHYRWAFWEEADSRLEAAYYLQQHPGFLGNRESWREQATIAEMRATRGLEIALGVIDPFARGKALGQPVGMEPAATADPPPDAPRLADDAPDDSTETDELDTELIANCYRVMADLRRLDTSRRNVSWGCYCAAALAAYNFVESQQDEYARRFYDEQTSRAMDRLMEFTPASDDDWISLVLICRFIQDFWSEVWRSGLNEAIDYYPALMSRDRDALRAALFPANPSVADASNPISLDRQSMAAVFERAPEGVKDIHPLLQPPRLYESLVAIRAASRTLSEPHAAWILDSVSGLHLRPVRRDDVDVLASAAQTAFGFGSSDNIVRDMLETHCNTPRTIKLDARKNTMMPTRYFVLTKNGKIIGLSGLYRAVWSRDTVFSLAWYFVEPGSRGTGMGKLLLNATMQIARKHNGTRMMIETSPDLTAAIGLYEKVGFQRVGEVPDYYGSGANLLLYTRDLAGIEVADSIPELL